MYNPKQWVFSISLNNGIVLGRLNRQKKIEKILRKMDSLNVSGY